MAVLDYVNLPFLIMSLMVVSFPLAAESDSSETSKESCCEATDQKKEEKPPKIGNFALPSSQQPASLYGFGGNVIDEGEVQLFFFVDEFVGPNRTSIDMLPNIVFGITDDWSLLLACPFTPLFRDQQYKSRGLEDFYIQSEYAFFNKSTSTYVDQVTLVTNVAVPTGSSKKFPPTGFGSPSFFVGTTYTHTMVDWFAFAAAGAILTTSNHRTQFGEQFLYQFTIGRNFPSPEGWIYAWLIDIDGQYNKKNRINGVCDQNSGGNFIFVTPALWISSKDVLIQFGVGFPINQNLFGSQRKFDYLVNLNLGWSFYTK